MILESQKLREKKMLCTHAKMEGCQSFDFQKIMMSLKIKK